MPLQGATKAAGKQNAEDCIEQRIEPSGRAKGDIHALLGARTAAGSNGRKRSASPFAKLGALIGEVSPVAGVGGLAQKAYGRARGAGAPGQTAGLGGSKVGRRKGETERARQDHGNGGASNAVAGGHGGAREDSPAFLAGRKSGASTGLLDGVASSSGRVADCVGRRAELRKAVSKVDPCAPYSLEDDDPWHVERDRSSQSTVRAQGRTERRGAPEPGDAEMGSNNPENGLVTSAVDDEVDSLDWFDGESLSDDETPDEDTAFPPPPKKLGSPTPFSETIIDLDPDAPILQPKRQPPPSRPRQTADVSARRGTTRVATSRILEASDFAERTSVDLFHWGGDADVAPGVPIYSKQRGGDRGAQRPPWKRERHKAKTHEDHRRRALERKSQLASAGLPLHLEADENVEELEVVSASVFLEYFRPIDGVSQYRLLPPSGCS